MQQQKGRQVMPWLRLDDQFSDHPKIVEAGPLAGWLHVCGMLYCSRLLTDGFIPAGQVRKLADVDNATELAERLISVGLWDRADGGYQVHDYLDYNPSRSKVLAEREANAARQGRYRERHSSISNDVSNAVTDTVSNAPPVPTPTPVPSTQPEPEPKPEDEVRVTAPPSPSDPVVIATAEMVSEASFVGDEMPAILKAVARSFELVPDFDTRDGPYEASQWAAYYSTGKGARKQPTNWVASFRKWLKQEVKYERRDASEPGFNGRTPRESGESGAGATDPDIERRGYDYDAIVSSRHAAAGR
jgi:hypothetical protein